MVEEDRNPFVGGVLDRYQIEEELGLGAMGAVYRATHTVIDREYAIKVLFGDFACDEKFRERFKREAQSISKIRHPNIVSVEDFGMTAEGVTFLVMELVEGQTLDQIIQQEHQISSPRTAHIVRQIAAGLGAAHDLGFVHRDVKPSNVMLTKKDGLSDFVKILDFGAVSLRSIPSSQRLTSVGHIIGTPAYMAPEQSQDPSVGPTADLYSIGCIIYEMRTGLPPFTGKGRAEVLVKHITEEAPRLIPSEGLEELTRRLLEKQPDKRPQTALEVVSEIDRLSLGATDPTANTTDAPVPRYNSTAPTGDLEGLVDTDEGPGPVEPDDEMFGSLNSAIPDDSWSEWDADGAAAPIFPDQTTPTEPPQPEAPLADTLPSLKRSQADHATLIVRERITVADEMQNEPELSTDTGIKSKQLDNRPTQVDFRMLTEDRIETPRDPKVSDTIGEPIQQQNFEDEFSGPLVAPLLDEEINPPSREQAATVIDPDLTPAKSGVSLSTPDEPKATADTLSEADGLMDQDTAPHPSEMFAAIVKKAEEEMNPPPLFEPSPDERPTMALDAPPVSVKKKPQKVTSSFIWPLLVGILLVIILGGMAIKLWIDQTPSEVPRVKMPSED